MGQWVDASDFPLWGGGGGFQGRAEPVSTLMRPPQVADEQGQERKLLWGYVTCCFTTTPGVRKQKLA